MNILRTIAREVVGLFIDDGALALLSLALIALVTVLVELAGLPAMWGALALLLGCLAILADSVQARLPQRVSRRAAGRLPPPLAPCGDRSQIRLSGGVGSPPSICYKRGHVRDRYRDVGAHRRSRRGTTCGRCHAAGRRRAPQ